MLDFQALRDKRTTLLELTAGLTSADLRALTNEMVDIMQALIRDCTDEDVVFVPEDPDAFDSYASSSAAVSLPWTLGHVIVHVTASAEEAAFLAAELARGVELHGRSRYETPWESVTTIAACRARLEESRRMRLATLDVWPDEPHLEVTYQPGPDRPRFNAIQRFVLGLRHDFNHLGQIAEIARQAAAARAMRVAQAHETALAR
jgi:hypothetical protein